MYGPDKLTATVPFAVDVFPFASVTVKDIALLLLGSGVQGTSFVFAGMP
jgi:hypothetical protein